VRGDGGRVDSSVPKEQVMVGSQLCKWTRRIADGDVHNHVENTAWRESLRTIGVFLLWITPPAGFSVDLWLSSSLVPHRENSRNNVDYDIEISMGGPRRA
jgi:hypothetical protein